MRLTDTDPMPIGKKFLGEEMQDVPASYLLWLWDQNVDKFKAGNLKGNMKDVMDYIEDNLDILYDEEGKIV